MKARELALNVLNKYENDKNYINLELKSALNGAETLEKALATELIYGVIRYRLNLDYVRNLLLFSPMWNLHKTALQYMDCNMTSYLQEQVKLHR